MDRLREKRNTLKAKILTHMKQVVHNGRTATKNFPFMGLFHHQYSKSLQPFLREAGTIPAKQARRLMEEAVRHARMGVKNNTNPESAYSHLAVIQYWSMRNCDHLADTQSKRSCQQKKFDRSMAALNKSIGHDRYYYDTHRMKAFLLMRKGDINGAIAEIKFSKRIIRNQLRAFGNVAKVDSMIKRALLRDGLRQAQQGKWSEAMAAYRAALDRYGEPMPEAHHLMGNALMRMKRLDEAEQELALALRQNRDFPAALLDLARLRLLRRDFTGAHRLLDRLLSPRIKVPEALLVRAWAYEMEQQIEPALADYRLFLKLKPQTPQASRVRQKIDQLSSGR